MKFLFKNICAFPLPQEKKKVLGGECKQTFFYFGFIFLENGILLVGGWLGLNLKHQLKFFFLGGGGRGTKLSDIHCHQWLWS